MPLKTTHCTFKGQRPSSAASGLISFGPSEEEIAADTFWQRLWRISASLGSAPEEPAHSFLDKWYLKGRHQQSSPTISLLRSCSAYVISSTSTALTTVDSAEERGYSKLQPLEVAVAAHLCPPSALGLKAHAAHPSKPWRTTSAGAGLPPLAKFNRDQGC